MTDAALISSSPGPWCSRSSSMSRWQSDGCGSKGEAREMKRARLPTSTPPPEPVDTGMNERTRTMTEMLAAIDAPHFYAAS